MGSRPSLSIALILHELATNALKYGALSVPGGRVAIDWSVSGPDSDRFELSWVETGGPVVTQPSGNGSGSRLIAAGLNGTLDSQVSIDYDPAGLKFRITADLETFQKEH